MKNFVSQEILKCSNRAHRYFDFVDVDLARDNKLFIDPCLIACSKSNWAKDVAKTIDSFFKEFYMAYRNGDSEMKLRILGHAGEENATRLGYGRGDNGRGNTAEGLLKDFKPLEHLVISIRTIEEPQDLPVFIPGFAEDGLSDLLTNVIHKELNDFTLDQLSKYGISPNSKSSFFTWDINLNNWREITTDCFKFKGDKVLLVPKDIVRKNYLFSTSQFFKRIILEEHKHEFKDSQGKSISKRDIEKMLKTDDEHWMYEKVIEHSKRSPLSLAEYHKSLPVYYFESGNEMSDTELDEFIYKR
ncbi:hypothetical protein [Anaerotignum propionicum]|uniref:Uncharacterized protein n=1 Tax=Anaerotignum propionicum DSM 1682 TaxID=991789 RepID=A0A110A6K0_ANAPI|nr:hypothetical protein [Anaerotignum propionicum]AMJ39778.1 hypothetical protein CPRO_01540 [Anaerotignum propionicum DSM 1682]SHE28698.1 hypothetical protein SAMN02745151_00200 [[Clostridium] propionicum DSM 1682] [Anaerotignum propionicum DSM 1682]